MASDELPTRLVIVANAALYREALSSLLSGKPYIALMAAVSSLSEMAMLIEDRHSMTILVDVFDLHTEMARELRSLAPAAGLLFLVDRYDLPGVISLLEAGAMGCISRDASVGELARAITAVGRGEISLPPSVASRALAALASGRLSDTEVGLVEDLTERESEVLHLLAEGMTNKDIAQALILSVRTVEAHLRSVYGKLGVGSRTEAALWAVRNGYGSQEQGSPPG